MYYTPWCSLCDIPQPKVVKTLNLLQCFRHIERKYFGDEDGMSGRRIRDRVWEGLCDWGNLSNDSTSYLPIVEAAEGDGSIGELDEDSIKLLQLMVEVFDLKNIEVQWEVSW
jgi:hypothetical protein